MKKRTIISIVIGTVILFVWNAVSWMGLPFHSNTLNTLPESAINKSDMKQSMPESGVYHYPGLPDANNSISDIEKKLAEGPRITLMVYKNSPTKLADPVSFLGSLIINLITVIFTFLVVSRFTPGNVLIGTVMVGVVTILVSDFSQMNWFMFPLDYTIINAIDKLVAFVLLGVLFAKYTFKGAEVA
ncbi:MAG: hypothetical protein NXI20_12260 [bacterium]|nr:hypothetical protein [bacterium]